MIEIYDDATLELAMALPLKPQQREAICRIVSNARRSSLWHLTCILVIEDNDADGDFEATLGFLPRFGPLGGEGAATEAYWAWRDDYGENIELLVTAGDSGFAWYLLMARAWFDSHIA